MFGTVMSASAANDDWAYFARYEKENSQLQEMPNDGHRVVFMGNSITENWVYTHPDFFTAHGFIGRGISGQTTYQYLVRFREDVINLKPAVVIINGGTNDAAENTCAFNLDRTIENIISMVELAQANGIKVILTSVLPVSGYYWNPSITDASARVDAINARLKAYADSKNITFVDYFSPMVSSGRTMNPAYSKDGVHPNSDGYDVMEAIILPVIAQALMNR